MNREMAMTDLRYYGSADIWRTAHALVTTHGREAPTRAARCADERKSAGDMDGFRAWIRVMEASENLLRSTPSPDETIH
jgi:hypothetical protein